PQNPALGPVGDALARATQSTAQVYRHDRGRVRPDGTCPHHRLRPGQGVGLRLAGAPADARITLRTRRRASGPHGAAGRSPCSPARDGGTGAQYRTSASTVDWPPGDPWWPAATAGPPQACSPTPHGPLERRLPARAVASLAAHS